MKARIKKDVSELIVEIVNTAEGGLGSPDVHAALKRRLRDKAPAFTTVKQKLLELVEDGAIVRTGKARAIKYRRPAKTPAPDAVDDTRPVIPVSGGSEAIRDYVRRPIQEREPIGYQREFLEEYIPNYTWYLPENTRRDLYRIGKIMPSALPAGSTYQPETVNRLLVDLSWASSRLEGNTYSRIDTENLFEKGIYAEGKDRVEATMILNHKRAIEMLLEGGESLGFNMYTFLNLHGLLSENLMGDPQDCGRLRIKAVEIGGSVYIPPDVPQVVEECFRLFLDKARDIEDPFEQSFFTMVHLPYLQPFTDVNKRVSRLGANIPLVKNRLCPLSFIDVPDRDYIEGNLGVYELTQTSLLQDVYVWAYQRSCGRYNVLKEKYRTGDPDPFRLKYTTALHNVTGDIIRNKLEATDACIAGLAARQVADDDKDKFISLVNDELKGVQPGLIRRYRVSLEEFNAWQQHKAAQSRSAQDTTATGRSTSSASHAGGEDVSSEAEAVEMPGAASQGTGEDEPTPGLQGIGSKP